MGFDFQDQKNSRCYRCTVYGTFIGFSRHVVNGELLVPREQLVKKELMGRAIQRQSITKTWFTSRPISPTKNAMKQAILTATSHDDALLQRSLAFF